MVTPLASFGGVAQSTSFVTKTRRFRQIGIGVTVGHENRAEVVRQVRDSFTS
jgi:hypothetical protein